MRIRMYVCMHVHSVVQKQPAWRACGTWDDLVLLYVSMHIHMHICILVMREITYSHGFAQIW
jgi:hypothetical protein